MCNVNNFIKLTGAVKTKPGAVFKLFIGIDFFLGQPATIGKSKFQFIAIINRWISSHNGQKISHLHLANATKRVFNDLLFVLQLRLIAQMLPFTTATKPIMLAKRFHPVFRILMKMRRFALHETCFLAQYHHIYYIAGRHAFYENDLPVLGSAHAFAFIGNAGNVYIF